MSRSLLVLNVLLMTRTMSMIELYDNMRSHHCVFLDLMRLIRCRSVTSGSLLVMLILIYGVYCFLLLAAPVSSAVELQIAMKPHCRPEWLPSLCGGVEHFADSASHLPPPASGCGCILAHSFHLLIASSLILHWRQSDLSPVLQP